MDQAFETEKAHSSQVEALKDLGRVKLEESEEKLLKVKDEFRMAMSKVQGQSEVIESKEKQL